VRFGNMPGLGKKKREEQDYDQNHLQPLLRSSLLFLPRLLGGESSVLVGGMAPADLDFSAFAPPWEEEALVFVHGIYVLFYAAPIHVSPTPFSRQPPLFRLSVRLV